MTTKSIYTVKGVKTFRSLDGGGFSSTLCRDGVKVAQVNDEGFGGPLNFNWLDEKASKVERTIIHVDKSAPNGERAHTMTMSPEEAKLHDHTLTLPKIKAFGMVLDVDSDVFVGQLVSNYQEENRIKRLLKSHLVMIKDNEVQTIKRSPTPEMIAQFRTSHPGVELLNDQPVETAVARALDVMKDEGDPIPDAPPIVVPSPKRSRPH